MEAFKGFLKGIVIGIGSVAPGISGGTFAMMLGIYDRLMDCVANFHKDIKNKIIFAAPVGLGIGVGVLAFSNVIKYLFDHYDVLVRFAFIGLMVGTLPYMFKEATKKGFKRHYVIPGVMAFMVTVGFALLDNATAQAAGGGPTTTVAGSSPLQMALYGAVLGLGTIVPGISSSFMLMYLGAYETLLDAVVNMDVVKLIPVGIGAVVCILLLAKAITWLFDQAYGATYHTVMGFVLGSVVAMVPFEGNQNQVFTGMAIALLSAGLSYLLARLGN